MTTKLYNTCFSLTNGHSHLIVDGGGGNGILSQMEKAGLSGQEVTDVFLTHLHTDHVLGAIWLARVVGQDVVYGTRQRPLTFYGHESVLAGLRRLCDVVLAPNLLPLFDRSILFQPVTDGQTLTLGHREVTFFDIGAKKTLQYGFRTDLANGESLCFLGDEPLHPQGEVYAQGASHLIHEAFCLEAEESQFQARAKAHSTAKDAGKNASRMGASHLILIHTSDSLGPAKAQAYQKEAQTIFKGKISVPLDLERVGLHL